MGTSYWCPGGHSSTRGQPQGSETRDGHGPEGKDGRHLAYPDSTPRTRLSTKKDPMMMRGMKYSQFHVAPKASLVWRGKKKKHV